MILSQVGIFQGSLPSHPSVYRSTAFSTLSAPLKNLLESQTHLNQIHSVLLRKLRKGDIRYTFQGSYFVFSSSSLFFAPTPLSPPPLAFPPAGEGMFFCEGGHAGRAPLHNLFPPFRIRRLVLDSCSNAERGSGGEV